MAKKDKEKDKGRNKKAKRASEQAAPPPVSVEDGAASLENEMRRIAREAAWARMFGRNDTKNPFGGPS